MRSTKEGPETESQGIPTFKGEEKEGELKCKSEMMKNGQREYREKYKSGDSQNSKT